MLFRSALQLALHLGFVFDGVGKLLVLCARKSTDLVSAGVGAMAGEADAPAMVWTFVLRP